MATADEILAAMSEDDDIPPEFMIDSDLRVIAVSAAVPVLGVEHDSDVHRIHFVLPRYYGDIDFGQFEASVNYRNAYGRVYAYTVDDMVADGDNLTFSWLVAREAFVYRGTVAFSICLRRIVDGEIKQEFNTTPAQMAVLEGLEVN